MFKVNKRRDNKMWSQYQRGLSYREIQRYHGLKAVKSVCRIIDRLRKERE